jgi:hypothetical protein
VLAWRRASRRWTARVEPRRASPMVASAPPLAAPTARAVPHSPRPPASGAQDPGCTAGRPIRSPSEQHRRYLGASQVGRPGVNHAAPEDPTPPRDRIVYFGSTRSGTASCATRDSHTANARFSGTWTVRVKKTGRCVAFKHDLGQRGEQPTHAERISQILSRSNQGAYAGEGGLDGVVVARIHPGCAQSRRTRCTPFMPVEHAMRGA